MPVTVGADSSEMARKARSCHPVRYDSGMIRILAGILVGLAACATSTTVTQQAEVSREAERVTPEPEGLSRDVDDYLSDAPMQRPRFPLDRATSTTAKLA